LHWFLWFNYGIGGSSMTELTPEHFELHDSNKDAMLQRNKLKFLEDRIATLEKSVGSLNKLTAEIWKHLEGDNNA
jgi:hypothetical protein